jgi:hypothetical protein
MTMYVYDTGGEPVGFLFETFIYDIAGAPLGRIMGSRVHRLDGSYAGEWLHQMVVERPSAKPRSVFPAFAPPPPPLPPACFRRRPAADHGRYRDAFQRLYERPGESDDFHRQAAE